MKIATSYILKQVFIGFLVLSLSLFGIAWLSQSLRFIDMTIGKGLPFMIFVRVTLLMIPRFVSVISPIALFAAVLFVYNRMSSDRELVVLKSAGFSYLQLAKAPIVIAILLTAVGYVFSIKIIPATYAKFREMQWQIRNDVSHLIIQEGAFNSIGDQITIYIEDVGNDGELKNIMVSTYNGKTKATILAEKGSIAGGGIVPRIRMENGSRQELDIADGGFSVLNFDSYTMDFDAFLDQDKRRQPSFNELSTAGLFSLRRQFRASGKTDKATVDQIKKLNVEIHDRFSKPLFNLAFAMLACIGVIMGHFSRQGNAGRMLSVVGTMILIQSMAIGLQNVAGKYNGFIFFSYFLPLSVTALCFYLALSNDPFARQREFFTRITKFVHK